MALAQGAPAKDVQHLRTTADDPEEGCRAETKQPRRLQVDLQEHRRGGERRERRGEEEEQQKVARDARPHPSKHCDV